MTYGHESPSGAPDEHFRVLCISNGGYVEKTFSRESDEPQSTVKLVHTKNIHKNTLEFLSWKKDFDKCQPDIYATFTFRTDIELETAKKQLHNALFVLNRKHFGKDTHIRYVGRGDYQSKRHLIDEGHLAKSDFDKAYMGLLYPEMFYHFHVAIFIDDLNGTDVSDICMNLKRIWFPNGVGYFVPWIKELTEGCLKYMFYNHRLDLEGLVCKRTGKCRKRQHCKI